eukprot:COSAG03_NODE_328_length_8950_cov_24.961021_7_plen_71_part_00
MGGVPWGNATNYIGEILGLRCGAPPHLAFVAPLALASTALKLNEVELKYTGTLSVCTWVLRNFCRPNDDH